MSSTHPIFEPGRLGSLALRNRIVKTATYEGMVLGGLPTESLLRHHRDLAKGGVGMTTVAYCAVSPEGKTFENQMVMREDTVKPLRAITDAVHAEGAAAMLQVGHAGGFSKNADLIGKRGPLGPSFGFNAYGAMKGLTWAHAMTADDIARTVGDFGSATWHAREAGFDAVELHLGHGYLLSQFLSPHRNRRKDEFGGSVANRLRFPLRVVEEARRRVGPDYPLVAKVNVDDGVTGGLHVDEAVEIAKALEGAGITSLVLSGGLVSHSAMYLLRGDRPLKQMIEVETIPMQKIALALFGPIFVPKIPYEPLFFLPMARKIRAAVKIPLVLVGGATSLDDLGRARREGFDFVAMGRALLHDPELPEKYRRGELVRSGCTPCNVCITEMDRAGGVICAKQPGQIAMREREVSRGIHLKIAGTGG